MRLFSYLSVAVLLVSGIVLTAYSPDLLSMVIVGFMCMITLAGCIYGLLPTISFTGGLLNGQNGIRKASGTEGSSAWVAALRIERFFQQKRLDKLFGEYREKVQHQRETGQIVSDIDEVLNEDVLALYTWRGVIAQIPGTLTGLGILGTFVGLLLGLRNISFVTVEAALGSVQSILAGIDTAFYTSIAGVILSILFNIINNVLRNIMNRETGLFLEEFHKTVIPTTDEQARYSSRREVRQILELLDRLPKNTGNGALTGEAMSGNGGNERVLMPQILDGLRKNEFTFFLQPRYELNTRKVIGAEALVRWNHPVLGVVSPAVFIPVLESNGYITKLDQYIWEEVCKTIRVWIDEGVRPMPITVNVTKTDILAIDVAEFFSGMLKKYRIPPKYLDIDISRTAYLESHDVLSETVAQLQQMGFRVVLDGFDGNYMELSIQIKKYRTELHLSQEELAEKVYVTRQTISNWENEKSYPDIHSLLLLSSLFNVSLDQLIKGDIEKMKEIISEQEIKKFNYYGSIYTVHLAVLIISAGPLFMWLGRYAYIPFGILFIITQYWALKVEKLKKKNDIQTYKEIVAFTEGKKLDELHKAVEVGKRPYQNILKVIISAGVTAMICFLIGVLMHLFLN